MSEYQVVLIAEDGEYVQDSFPTYVGAENYISENKSSYGEGQELVIDSPRAWNSQ